MKKAVSIILAAGVMSVWTWAAEPETTGFDSTTMDNKVQEIIDSEENNPGAAGEEETAPVTVASDKLEVTIPAEIAAICDIESSAESISIFEKISHKKPYGGFVGSLQLYESVKDYGYLPSFKRVGELKLADGTILSVVAEFASDVPYDVFNEDSISNYQTLREAFDTVIVQGLKPINEEDTFTPQELTDTASIFREVLETLTDDLDKQKSAEELLAEDFSYMYAYSYNQDSDPGEIIGYAFTDVDYDGYSELVIGEVGQKEIYDMFTQVDGEIHHIISGGERDRWYFTGNEYRISGLKNEAAGGAGYTMNSFYNLISGEDLQLQTSFVYDSYTYPEQPFRIEYSYGDGEAVSEEEWTTLMGNYGETIAPDFQPLK